jgi:hypothetical protein
MQTLEFTDALKEIVNKMKVDLLIATLQKWLTISPNQNPPLTEQEKSQFSNLVFDSYAGYSSLASSERTARILAGLDVKDFYEANRLRILVTSVSGFSMIAQVRVLPEAHAFFEKLRSLQTLAATCVDLLEREKVGTVEPSDEILELELIDYDGKGIEPERLREFVATVRRLYMNLSRIHGVEGDQFRFKYFDSGSNVLMGIQGIKEVIVSMSTVMLQWWDKIWFARYDTFDKKIDAVSKSLTLMETVHQAVEKQVIDEETGKNLKRRVLVEVDRLTGLGATVPFKAEVTVDQQKILIEMRDVKLLESGQKSEAEADDPNDVHRKFRD